MSLQSEARKEKKEHPWTTMSQARRIAKDHLMKISRYSVTVKHDGGRMTFRTAASSAAAAAHIVCKAEGCPRSAIVSIRADKRKNPCRSNSNVPLRKKKATKVSTGATINVVRLYSIDVVTHDLSTGKITLRTGGWTTTTTVARMNQYAQQFGVPYRVNIKNRTAVVTVQGKSYPFDNEIIIQL